MGDKIELLKVLIGSRAHGLAREDSDYDYRGVYIAPMTRIALSEIGGVKTTESWRKDEGEDSASYEIGHFLKLALKSNPNILEVFKAPIIDMHKIMMPVWPNTQMQDLWGEKGIPLGQELRDLFPSVWSSKAVYDSFSGYSKNQLRKYVDDLVGERARKYAIAAVRSFKMGFDLLTTGDFTVDVRESTELFDDIVKIRDGKYTAGEIFEVLELYRGRLDDAYNGSDTHYADIPAVADWLTKVRRAS